MYSKKLSVLRVRPNTSDKINYYFYSSLTSTSASYLKQPSRADALIL
jgi:hypothetical protein